MIQIKTGAEAGKALRAAAHPASGQAYSCPMVRAPRSLTAADGEAPAGGESCHRALPHRISRAGDRTPTLGASTERTGSRKTQVQIIGERRLRRGSASTRRLLPHTSATSDRGTGDRGTPWLSTLLIEKRFEVGLNAKPSICGRCTTSNACAWAVHNLGKRLLVCVLLNGRSGSARVGRHGRRTGGKGAMT